jgi:hypothetical protein
MLDGFEPSFNGPSLFSPLSHSAGLELTSTNEITFEKFPIMTFEIVMSNRDGKRKTNKAYLSPFSPQTGDGITLNRLSILADTNESVKSQAANTG